MHEENGREQALPHIVWIGPGRLDKILDAATWLEMTRELRDLGWRITLICSGNKGVESIRGVEVLTFSYPDIYLLRQLVFHLKVLWHILHSGSSTSIVFFNQPSAPWVWFTYQIRKLNRHKHPLYIMDTRTVPMEDKATSSLRDRIRGWFYNHINSWANTWVDGQTAITRRMADWVRIPDQQLWGVWPSGASIDFFLSSRQLRDWTQLNERVNLIYVGVLHYERKLLELSKAVMLAAEKGMNFHLYLTGDGSQRRELEDFAATTGGRIMVNPPIPHSEIPRHLTNAHIGVLPFPDEPKYRVSSPIKLFEYMASGMPILATRIVCHTDVIQDGKYVFWSDDASVEGLLNALQEIWINREKLQSMGELAAKDSIKWTWKESARHLSHAFIHGLMVEKSLTSMSRQSQKPAG